MSEPLRIRVTFRKQVSDGNYGTEAAEVTLEYDVEPGDDENQYTDVLLTDARTRVHAELSRSPSSNVRRALEPPRRVVPPPAEPVDEDHVYTEVPF